MKWHMLHLFEVQKEARIEEDHVFAMSCLVRYLRETCLAGVKLLMIATLRKL